MSLLGRRSPLAEMPCCWRKIPITLIDPVSECRRRASCVNLRACWTRFDCPPLFLCCPYLRPSRSLGGCDPLPASRRHLAPWCRRPLDLRLRSASEQSQHLIQLFNLRLYFLNNGFQTHASPRFARCESRA